MGWWPGPVSGATAVSLVVLLVGGGGGRRWWLVWGWGRAGLGSVRGCGRVWCRLLGWAWGGVGLGVPRDWVRERRAPGPGFCARGDRCREIASLAGARWRLSGGVGRGARRSGGGPRDFSARCRRGSAAEGVIVRARHRRGVRLRNAPAGDGLPVAARGPFGRSPGGSQENGAPHSRKQVVPVMDSLFFFRFCVCFF